MMGLFDLLAAFKDLNILNTSEYADNFFQQSIQTDDYLELAVIEDPLKMLISNVWAKDINNPNVKLFQYKNDDLNKKINYGFFQQTFSEFVQESHISLFIKELSKYTALLNKSQPGASTEYSKKEIETLIKTYANSLNYLFLGFLADKVVISTDKFKGPEILVSMLSSKLQECIDYGVSQDNKATGHQLLRIEAKPNYLENKERAIELYILLALLDYMSYRDSPMLANIEAALNSNLFYPTTYFTKYSFDPTSWIGAALEKFAFKVAYKDKFHVNKNTVVKKGTANISVQTERKVESEYVAENYKYTSNLPYNSVKECKFASKDKKETALNFVYKNNVYQSPIGALGCGTSLKSWDLANNVILAADTLQRSAAISKYVRPKEIDGFPYYKGLSFAISNYNKNINNQTIFDDASSAMKHLNASFLLYHLQTLEEKYKINQKGILDTKQTLVQGQFMQNLFTDVRPNLSFPKDFKDDDTSTWFEDVGASGWGIKKGAELKEILNTYLFDKKYTELYNNLGVGLSFAESPGFWAFLSLYAGNNWTKTNKTASFLSPHFPNYTVGYRVVKHRGPSNEIVQQYYIDMQGETDALFNIIDSQLLYEQNYKFSVNSIMAAPQISYKYVKGSVKALPTKRGFHIDVYEKLHFRTFEYCLTSAHPVGSVYDFPPIPSNVKVFPIKNNANNILFLFEKTSGGSYKNVLFKNIKPQFWESGWGKAQNTFVELYGKENLPTRSAIPFQTQPIKSVKVYRKVGGPVPKSFDQSEFTEVYKELKIDNFVNMFSDVVEPNVKYYYLFKFVNDVGMSSFADNVYHIEIIDDGAITYPVIEVLKLANAPEPPKRKRSINFKKNLRVEPALLQVAPNQEKADLGFSSPSVFTDRPAHNARKFGEYKFRVTSKKTGRKVDFNVTFIKSLNEPEDKLSLVNSKANEVLYTWKAPPAQVTAVKKSEQAAALALAALNKAQAAMNLIG
jgi:hypothetical protein